MGEIIEISSYYPVTFTPVFEAFFCIKHVYIKAPLSLSRSLKPALSVSLSRADMRARFTEAARESAAVTTSLRTSNWPA